MVEPDLLAERNSVDSRQIESSQAWIWAGSVESRTLRSGNPSLTPKHRRSTSGHKLDPPMPRSTAWL